MTAAQVLACLKQLDSATLRALEARIKDPRHLFVLTLIDEIQGRTEPTAFQHEPKQSAFASHP